MPQLLGIDYGLKRVGIALSDDEQTLALPHAVFDNDEGLIHRISDLVKERNVEAVVIGESRDFKGRPNPIMKDIAPFARKLSSALSLPVRFEPELLTSVEAEKLRCGTGHADASAAAVILQSYMDKRK